MSASDDDDDASKWDGHLQGGRLVVVDIVVIGKRVVRGGDGLFL